MVPTGVIEELGHPSAPRVVADWLLNLPSWIDVRSVGFATIQAKTLANSARYAAFGLIAEGFGGQARGWGRGAGRAHNAAWPV